MKKEFITKDQMVEIMDKCYDAALNGVPGSKPCKLLADEYMSQSKFDIDKAIKNMINVQIAKCATSGFLTNLGGLITLPIAVPANVGSVLYIQLRMIAAIAYMGGYDPSDDTVQTLAYVCLTGMSVADLSKKAGIKFGEKLTTSTINKIPGKVLTKINQAVGFRFITKAGEKGIINLTKMVPFVGGAIGGGVDAIGTKAIGEQAYKTFILKKLD